MAENDDVLVVPEEMYIMAEEPIPGWTPDMVRELRIKVGGESGLAQAYAAASNKAWWVEDDIYDFEEGSNEYIEAVACMDAWFAVEEELLTEIFEILRSEGVVIPENGYVSVLRPFMARNGFLDSQGWWTEDDDEN